MNKKLVVVGVAILLFFLTIASVISVLNRITSPYPQAQFDGGLDLDSKVQQGNKCLRVSLLREYLTSDSPDNIASWLEARSWFYPYGDSDSEVKFLGKKFIYTSASVVTFARFNFRLIATQADYSTKIYTDDIVEVCIF